MLTQTKKGQEETYAPLSHKWFNVSSIHICYQIIPPFPAEKEDYLDSFVLIKLFTSLLHIIVFLNNKYYTLFPISKNFMILAL